jgi:glucose-6-phosphate isomerase
VDLAIAKFQAAADEAAKAELCAAADKAAEEAASAREESATLVELEDVVGKRHIRRAVCHSAYP